MAERAASWAEVHVDFGTGDGAFAYRTARHRSRTLVVGVDSNGELMGELSWRASRKPARGGLPNVLFGRLSLAETPGELVHLADLLTVLFPWGSLLRAVAVPEPGAVRNLARVAKPGGRIRFLFGYGPRDAGAADEHRLPALGTDGALRALEAAYRVAGFRMCGRYVPREEVAGVQTTWAKKLAFSGFERVFVELRGQALP